MSSLKRILLAAAVALGATSAAAAVHIVNVNAGMTFTPANLDICLGDTVTWQWSGSSGLHTVTSADRTFPCDANGAWDSGPLNSGTFSHTFTSLPPQCAADDSPGAETCSYVCTIHCGMMSGVITVNTDLPAGGVGISRSKLRIAHDPTQGRGGTIIGVETLDGTRFRDAVPGTTDLKLILDGPGLPDPISDTIHLNENRGDFTASSSGNDADAVSIVLVKLIVGSDPTLAKLTLKYETNGFDVGAAGPLTATVEISHVVPANCAGGSVPVISSGSAPVKH